MLKWYLGSFQTGEIDKSKPLPVIKGSSKIYHDINGESSGSVSLSVSDLPENQRKNWKIAFESYNRALCAIDDSSGSEEVVFWGFIDNTKIQISSGALDLKASGMLEYLKTRLIVPVFSSEDDATKTMVFQAANWNGVIKRLINSAFSTLNFPSDAPRPPANMDVSSVQSGDARKMECLYTDAFSYGDKIEEVRDEASNRGEEIFFSNYSISGSRVEVVPLVGSTSSPKIRYGSNLNIQLADNNWKILSSSSVSSGEGKATRFIIQSKADEEETDLQAKYTRGSSRILVDDFWNSSVELTEAERVEQLESRSSDMDNDTLELELEVVEEQKSVWMSHLGKKLTLSGVPDTISEGHDAVVRLVGVSLTDDSRVVLDVMSPMKRYPRLPKRRATEEKRKAKKESKLKNQKYYAGGAPSAWDRSSLSAGGGYAPPSGPGGGSTDPVDPGDLGPGLGGEWGTGGAGEEGEVPIEGDVGLQYRYISKLTSNLFGTGDDVVAQNNTIWNSSKLISYSQNMEFPHENASKTPVIPHDPVWTGRINAGIIYRGGISDPGVAKHVEIGASQMQDFIHHGFTNYFPAIPDDYENTTRGTTYENSYRLHSVQIESYNIVVIDNHVFVPIVARIRFEMQRRAISSDPVGNWTTVINNPNIQGAFLGFLKAPITSTREVGEFSIDYRSFRADMGSNASITGLRFVRYGSWIMMIPGSGNIYAGAANYATGGSAFSTWWNWNTSGQSDLALARDKFGQDFAVALMDGVMKACKMEVFPVPRADQEFVEIGGFMPESNIASVNTSLVASAGRMFIIHINADSGGSGSSNHDVFLVDATDDGSGYEATQVGGTGIVSRVTNRHAFGVGSSVYFGGGGELAYGVIEELEEDNNEI